MNATLSQAFMQHWNVVQHDLNKADAAPEAHGDLIPAEAVVAQPTVTPPPAKKRGRPRRGEVRAPAKESPISRPRKLISVGL